jgi:hypothetical protein
VPLINAGYENRTNNGKNPGIGAESPGKSPGIISDVRTSFARQTSEARDEQEPCRCHRRHPCSWRANKTTSVAFLWIGRGIKPPLVPDKPVAQAALGLGCTAHTASGALPGCSRAWAVISAVPA